MRRQFLPCLILLLASASGAPAAEWAGKMFEVTSHDFGTLARGVKAQHRFKLTNLYEEDVHISGVRSSCGCTTPQVTKNDLATFETAEIVADFNTRAFMGHKSATLTVSFDKPFSAEVQLHVNGFIRSDVVLQPGELDFGTVDLGVPAEKRMTISYAGRQDWQLFDVKSAYPHFECELLSPTRSGGKVSYELLVRLTKDAPAGYINDQLILVTNDEHATELPVEVHGRVASSLTVSPASLFMGMVQPGHKVTKQLVVRSRKPFRILSIECEDDSFQVEATGQRKAVHLLPVVFTASDHSGKVSQKISITTDQGDNALQCMAYAQVVEGVPTRASSKRAVRSAPIETSSEPAVAEDSSEKE